ncbi:Dit2 protein [Histoplasma ohiense]|nr:Dit2 protein [Histoplasma ohiense (nom. inval.)]
MKAGIQRRITDTSKLLGRSRQLVRGILQSQQAATANFGIDLESLVQMYAIYVVGEHFFQTDFQRLECNEATRLAKYQTAIRGNVFSPLYFSFPILDKYPYIFQSRKRAFRIVKEYEDLLYEIVRVPRPRETPEDPMNQYERQVIDDLRDALDCRKITEVQFRANVKIIFVAGHEDVQHLLNSAFYEMGAKTVSSPI